MNEQTNTAPRILHIICKMPLGILMELAAKGEPNYQKRLLKGANEGYFRGDGSFVPTTIGGYGRTEVASEYYEAWKKANRKYAAEMEAKKIIVVCNSKDEAEAAALDGATILTGFEPLNPDKLPVPGLTKVPPDRAAQ